MSDNAPVVSEFLPNACTCSGDYTGCAVCSVASTLLRYGKSIPRLSNGTPSMRSLGLLMGAKHRAEAPAGTDGDRHGLSLFGHCSPPEHGTNWCARCAFLELRSRGLPVGYAKLSDSQILAHLKAGHTLIVPGLYSEVPLVARNSYSATVPARGRSDSGFGGWHMVAAHGVKLNGTVPVSVIISDSDFGSTSRPIVPPHSEWSWATFLRYYHRAGWSITYVNARPAGATQVPPTPAPVEKWSASVHTSTGLFFVYTVTNGVIVGRSTAKTGGFSATCSAPRVLRWPALHRSVNVVRLTSGARKGQYIDAKFAHEV